MEKGNERIGEARISEAELYNSAQMLLVHYMLLKGIISNPSEYVDKGYEGAFRLLASGAISVPPEIDWQEIREKVKKVTEI